MKTATITYPDDRVLPSSGPADERSWPCRFTATTRWRQGRFQSSLPPSTGEGSCPRSWLIGGFIRCGELRDQAREAFEVPGGDDPVISHLMYVHRADLDSSATRRVPHERALMSPGDCVSDGNAIVADDEVLVRNVVVRECSAERFDLRWRT